MAMMDVSNSLSTASQEFPHLIVHNPIITTTRESSEVDLTSMTSLTRSVGSVTPPPMTTTTVIHDALPFETPSSIMDDDRDEDMDDLDSNHSTGGQDTVNQIIIKEEERQSPSSPHVLSNQEVNDDNIIPAVVQVQGLSDDDHQRPPPTTTTTHTVTLLLHTTPVIEKSTPEDQEDKTSTVSVMSPPVVSVLQRHLLSPPTSQGHHLPMSRTFVDLSTLLSSSSTSSAAAAVPTNTVNHLTAVAAPTSKMTSSCHSIMTGKGKKGGDSSQGPPIPTGKSAKNSSTKGMGCGRPGYITCSICSATKYYSHVQRRFGQFSCEPCSKFMKRFLRDPKKYTCFDAGSCVIGRPSGEQEPRGVSVSRCKACWLKICLDKFVLEPNTREVIHQHYLPVFVVNGSSGSSTAVMISTNSSSAVTASGLRSSNSSSNTHVVNHLSKEVSKPMIPLPSRKRKAVKESLELQNNNSSSSHGSSFQLLDQDSSSNGSTAVNQHTSNSNPFLLINSQYHHPVSSSSPFSSSSSGSSIKSSRTPRKSTANVKYKNVEVKSDQSKELKGRRRGKKRLDEMVMTKLEGEEVITDFFVISDQEVCEDSVKKSSVKGSFLTSTPVGQSSQLIPVKRRRRKAKGFLTHNLDHDYGASMIQDRRESQEDSDENNDTIDVIEHGFYSSIQEVVVKMETTEDLESTTSSSSQQHKLSGVVLRESNEDNHQPRSRLGSIGAANAHALMNLSYRLGIHPRVEPESPKPGTKAEDSMSASFHDPSLYSTAVTDAVLSTEGETVFSFEATTPVKATKGRRRNKKDLESPIKRRRQASGKAVKRLNQENHNNRNRKNSSSLNCFGDSKYRVTSSSCSDVDLTDHHHMSLQGFLHVSDHGSHGSHKKLLHHHPRYHLDNHGHLDDEDSQNEEEDAVDDDEGYDDYFDPLTARETARDSLFFDEILNTNSPFL